MIVVTTPTGQIGRQVLDDLIKAEAAVRVVARDPAQLPLSARDRVEVIEGSHSRPEVVARAFKGAKAVFWLVPADPKAQSARAAYDDFAKPACEALRAQGVQRVVCISALGQGWPEDAGNVTATLEMDELLAGTGVAYRALAFASLMENALRQLGAIKEKNSFQWPLPADLKAPTVATRDIAAIAVKLLLDSSWDGVDRVPLLGPEDLSFEEMMVAISNLLGRTIKYRQLPLGDLRTSMLERGASAGMAEAMVNMMAAKSKGLDSLPPRVPSNAADTPTTFRQWAREVLVPAAS